MSKIINAWEDARISYQHRYAQFAKKYQQNKNDRVTLGHLHECSHVLINIFGLTSKQVGELEQYDYCGLTNDDFGNL